VIQEHGAVIIHPRRQVSEVRRGQPSPRQVFEIRNTEHLIGSDGGGIGGRLCRRQTEAKTGHAEQRRSGRQATENQATRSRGRNFIVHREPLLRL
jgi:hypothetical protein